MIKFKWSGIFLLVFFLTVAVPSLKAEVQEIEPEQLQSFMKNHPGTQLLDVREGWERSRTKIPKSLYIPMGDITTARDKLNMEKPVITYCKSGIRSRNAAQILEKIGFKEVYTLKGGLEAYWVEVDPNMPQY